MVMVATTAGSRLLQPGAVDTTHTRIPEVALQPFFRFDAIWYHAVWESGYRGPLAVNQAPFYPVYPALVRLVGIVLGNDLASLLISNLGFLLALSLIYQIATRYLTADTAVLSLWLLALWPWSIFYSYPYAESVELLLVAGAFLLMERGSWLWAGLVAAFAGASRPSGILAGLGFVGELVARTLRTPRADPPPQGRTEIQSATRREIAPVLIGGALSGVGLLAFCLILLRETGNPFEFLRAQRLWVGPYPRNPLFPITSMARLITRHSVLDTEAPVFVVLVAFVGAVTWSFRRLPFRYGLWGAGFIVVAVLHGYYVRSFTAVPRHMLEWFPVYLAFGVLLSTPRLRVVRVAWFAGSVALLAAYAAMFGGWHFVS